VDRLPFSIVLQSHNQSYPLYKAFTRTVKYETWLETPTIRDYESPTASVPSGTRSGVVAVVSPNGHVESENRITFNGARTGFLTIDAYGHCSVHNGPGRITKIPNPAQHPLQVEVFHRGVVERQHREAEEKRKEDKRRWDMFNRGPYEDVS